MAVQLYKGGNLIISYAMVSDQLISSSEKVSSWIFLKNKMGHILWTTEQHNADVKEPQYWN